MIIKVFKKVNEKVKFLFGQNKYLTRRLKTLLCGFNPILILIVVPLLNKNIKQNFRWHKTNACLGLGLPHRSHIGAIHPRKINWLQVSYRVESSIGATVFKYWKMIVHHISICLSLHTIGTILDHKWYWTYHTPT